MKKRYLLLTLLTILSATSCIKSSAKVTEVTLSGNISESLSVKHPLKSKGDVNVLYVPLNFDNSYNDTNLSFLDKTLNGTDVDTGYYSLKDYISTSSYQKLNLSIDRIETIQSAHSIEYYKENDELETSIIDNLNNLDLSKYDNDNDKYVDYVCFVYISGDLTSTFKYEERFNNNFTKDLNVKINDTYSLSNVSFVDYRTLIGKYESKYDSKNIKLSCHELVHQLGYAFGLLDECDRSNLSSDTKMYYSTMMSGVCGDFSSSDKVLLGWANTYVTSGKFDVSHDLFSFETTGDVILWSDHTISNVFDEYVILEIYSNSLLNKLGRVKTTKENETFYALKVTKVDNTLNKNSNNKPISNEKQYDSSAFKFDNCGENSRVDIRLSKTYNETEELTKSYFYLSGNGGSISEQFKESGKIPALTFSYTSISDKFVSSIKLVL